MLGAMDEFMVTIRGQRFAPDIGLIEKLLAEHPAWGRKCLSVRLCELWDWRGPHGQLKDMACRTLLLRLERAGRIVLPPRQRASTNAFRNRVPRWVAHGTEPIATALKSLLPLQIRVLTPGSEGDALFRCLLAHYHYLGYQNSVGENLRYLVHSRQGEPLACVLFGSAAWKLAARERFIGWSTQARAARLSSLTNNTRFLILPWVQVPHLASHILGRIARRLSADWMAKYGHALYLLETFVERDRHRGICYQAANWTWVGQTRGRTRNDRAHTLHAPLKDIYLYPLQRDFREALCRDP